ncbi:MAG: ATP-binding protein [Anaerolineae bacterium]|nr:ATP-binding protein [Anaerolineae bacterium]MDW8173316.1 ATP-binding protein [Anaerolineae bacterium]
MSAARRELEVAATLDQLQHVTAFVVNAGRETTRLTDHQLYHCELSVDEIFSNIIEHGFKHQGASHTVRISCQALSDRFEIIIRDDAPAFDPFKQQAPAKAFSLDDGSVGGWGLRFVMTCMDSVEYRHEDGENWIILGKKYT